MCRGRLTLESGIPVSSSDQTAKTNIYFTPFEGGLISLYDGTRWRLHAFTELTLALGTLTSGANYDVFVYDNAGTLTLELSAAWASATSRTDAIAFQDGVQVKSGATTRRLVGTIRTTSTTTTEDSLAKRYVANLYNRVVRPLYQSDETGHTYNSTTFRNWNNSALQYSFVTCFGATIQYSLTGVLIGTASYPIVAAGLDWTSGDPGKQTWNAGTNVAGPPMASTVIVALCSAGYHYVSALEALATGSTSSTFSRIYMTGAVLL